MRPPLIHQASALEASKDRDVFALFFEQRCGKTKVVIDTAAYQFQKGAIDTVIVLAWPNGVQNVWAEEWPKDWPEDEPYQLVPWRSGRMETDEVKERLRALVRFNGMSVVAMNCEAMPTRFGDLFLQTMLKMRRGIMLVADESSWAKTPKSVRTTALQALGRHRNVRFKRILDGTPADEGPLDLWAPCFFLNWQLLGHKTFFGYKQHYSIMEEGYAPGGRRFKKVVGYRNLAELNERLGKFSIRVRRADVSDAPPKVYQTRYFQMTDKQRRVYDRLRDEYVAELSNGENPVAGVLKRMTRLQMIARNYYPPEEGGHYCEACSGEGEDCELCGGMGIVVETSKLQRIDTEVNPAQGALVVELQQLRKPAVIWCMFRQDVLDAMEASRMAGRTAVQFDGSITNTMREQAYNHFREGRYDDIVATIGSGLSRGRDLTRAGTLIYYSNVYSLRARRQSEDRAESMSRDYSTDIIDLVAEDTRDLHNIQALRDKRLIAEIIVGDPVEAWI